jgi:3-hydroxyanthranilate 3,4-dioxygenase
MIGRSPLHFQRWIESHRDRLRPPVGNQLVWEDAEFIIMVVGSNTRKDFHVNQGEEFFHQIEGDMVLKVHDEGKIVDIPIKQGEIFLLPPRVPHSPRRPLDTVGLVVERRRKPEELDGFQWYCEQCGQKLYEEFIPVTNIVTQLPPLFERFYGDLAKRTCKACGAVVAPPVRVG